MGWEGRFLLFLQDNVRSPVLDKIMQFITSLGDAGLIAIAACIVLLCIRSYRQAGFTASLSLILDFFFKETDWSLNGRSTLFLSYIPSFDISS